MLTVERNNTLFQHLLNAIVFFVYRHSHSNTELINWAFAVVFVALEYMNFSYRMWYWISTTAFLACILSRRFRFVLFFIGFIRLYMNKGVGRFILMIRECSTYYSVVTRVGRQNTTNTKFYFFVFVEQNCN